MSQPVAQQFEVELKFRVPSGWDVQATLARSHATFQKVENQCDEYWNHPERDFARTDEALRIRSVDERHAFTYKGPKRAGTAKTRREIELELSPGTRPESAREFLQQLSFRPTAAVVKQREQWLLGSELGPIAIAIDSVQGLGLFVELELVVGEPEIPQAHQILEALAANWGLSEAIRDSYLALLLNQRDG